MLKVAIENSYTNQYDGTDEFGARLLMQEIFKKDGIELVRVSINKINKKGEFTEYNILTKKGKSKTIRKIYKPDIIRSRRGVGTYYKYSILEKLYKITPSKKVSIISNDKYETYLFCKKYQPKTILLSNSSLISRDIITTNKFVIKPIRANGGKGIELMNKELLEKNKEKYIGLEELYIIQEFKNFSEGYPGIIDGNHDVRLMFAGKNIIEATLRIPEKGNFKSNIGSGGKQFPLEIKKIPIELKKISKNIYKKLDLQGDDIFSMDFAYCKVEKKWYLIEINSSPGTRYYQTNLGELEKIINGLIVFFKSL